MQTETSHSYRNANATDYDKQAQAFLDKHGIKFRATLSDSKVALWAGDRKDHRLTSSADPHHYRVTLSKGAQGQGVKFGRRIVFDFWGSIADAEKGIETVKPYAVLACISGDVHCAETFKDFCGDFGENEDSIKALQTFRRCSAFSKRLRAFFTAKEIEDLQEIQ